MILFLPVLKNEGAESEHYSGSATVKEISPGCSLEGLMLKLQYFGHLLWRADSLEGTLLWERLKKAGGEGDDTGWDGWMVSLTRWTWIWESSGRWWWTGKPGVLQSIGLQRVGRDWVTEQQQKLGKEKAMPQNLTIGKHFCCCCC